MCFGLIFNAQYSIWDTLEPKPLNTKIVYVAHLPGFCPGLNFVRPQLGLKHPLPPFAIHILNRLDMRIHQVASKIYTYIPIQKFK